VKRWKEQRENQIDLKRNGGESSRENHPGPVVGSNNPAGKEKVASAPAAAAAAASAVIPSAVTASAVTASAVTASAVTASAVTASAAGAASAVSASVAGVSGAVLPSGLVASWGISGYVTVDPLGFSPSLTAAPRYLTSNRGKKGKRRKKTM